MSLPLSLAKKPESNPVVVTGSGQGSSSVQATRFAAPKLQSFAHWAALGKIFQKHHLFKSAQLSLVNPLAVMDSARRHLRGIGLRSDVVRPKKPQQIGADNQALSSDRKTYFVIENRCSVM